MSNTNDILNVFYDLLKNILPVDKFGHSASKIGTERIVLNTIPVNQSRAGSLRMNNLVVNVNFFVPKTSLGEINSARIDQIDKLIQTAIEGFNTTTRVGYCHLDANPSTTFNESEKESLTNIRVITTYT